MYNGVYEILKSSGIIGMCSRIMGRFFENNSYYQQNNGIMGNCFDIIGTSLTITRCLQDERHRITAVLVSYLLARSQQQASN